jgi:phosphatidylinositol phospholipase C delta
VVIKGRRPNNLDLGVYDFDDDVSDDGAPSTIFGTEVAAEPLRKEMHHGVCPALARLTLFHGTKLKSWDESIMNPTHNMHSFSENKIRSLARKTDRKKWVIYNQSHMSRTYPGGSRVDSSNYMPLLAWSVGCQLVALNFQTNDAALRLNDGRFRENGGCGYVLKPTGLMEMQSTKGPVRTPLKLFIRILSGSCLPKPKEEKTSECIDPYVRVSVYDVKNEKEVSTSFQTSKVYNNGFFPIWNEEKFTFMIENSYVAMLQLSIYDKDVLVASASIPISCLRLGLRSVKLYDATNTRSGAFDFASLLIEVKKDRHEAGLGAEKDRHEAGLGAGLAEF